MPYVIVFQDPPMQIFVKDALFEFGPEVAPEKYRDVIKEEISRDRFLVGENVDGGIVVVALDKINFIQALTDEELQDLKERRKTEAANRPAGRVTVPSMVIPRKVN